MQLSETTIRQESLNEEVQEIISHRPHGMVRHGNLVFFLLLCCLLLLAAFVSYPDVVRGRAKLVALNAPKLVTAKAEGSLVQLLVHNEQQVVKGAHLAYLHSTAQHHQVIGLLQWLQALIHVGGQQSDALLSKGPPQQFSNLGELQPQYQEFGLVLAETVQLLASGYYTQKRSALHKDLAFLKQLQQNTGQQRGISEQDYNLQQITFDAKTSLFKDKVIAPLELNEERSRLLAKESGLRQLQAQEVNSAFSLASKQKELLELDKLIADQRLKFSAALLRLKSAVEEWMQHFVVQAPESGKVIFLSPVQEAQFVALGQELFYIAPDESRYYGELMVGQTGIGKIKNGQPVLLKLDGYPSAEFGTLKGVVEHISAMPVLQDSFRLRVCLPKGLHTNYGRALYFKNGLSAGAEVLTDDRKLLERLVGEMRNVLKM